MPPIAMIQRVTSEAIHEKFFHGNDTPKIEPDANGEFKKPGSKPLKAVFKK